MDHLPGLLLLTAVLLATGPTGAGGAPDYPPPPLPKDPTALGAGIQRTMTLLATSTPQHRNRVRILFYGQSITEQDWWKRVADDLRARFPHANLEIENRAIGGFASQMLIRPAEHDLYPFYPDLLIFHVYGSDQEYERIIREVRARTTAEVLMQKDHLTKWPPAVIDENQDKGAWWDDRMNNRLLPEIAGRYGCGLADNRAGWSDYLKAHHLEPQALLSDGVHLNDHGNYLMAELMKRYLVYRPGLPKAGWQGLVRDHAVGREVRWNRGRLALEFEGNRVDVLPAGPGQGRAARVLIDGRKPSTFPALYAVTPRPTPQPWSPLALVRVDHDAPLVAETWTLKVTEMNADSSQWRYAVTGSVTGPDGEGQSAAPFVSKSGRVKIAPDAFFRGFGREPVPVGYEITWRVVPLHADTLAPPAAFDPARDNAITLAQGLPNGKHTLELIADGPAPAIRAVRVYRPPVR